MPNIPEIIKAHAAYANPYKITRAHGIEIEQSGKYRNKDTSRWQKINYLQNFKYPKIEFQQNLKFFLKSHSSGIINTIPFSKTKSYGVIRREELQSDKLLQNCIIDYLTALVWMPWSFTSKHVVCKELSTYEIEVSLINYPQYKGTFYFSKEARILSFSANRHQYESGNYVLREWRLEFSKYNIKKSYKLPTQVKFYWVKNEVTELYLELNKVIGFSVN